MTLRLLRPPGTTSKQGRSPLVSMGGQGGASEEPRSEHRAARVEVLREQYMNGTLRIDAHEVARRMLIRLLA